MIERLLQCKLCGGKVSSLVQRCPHCGSPNFKPDNFQHAEAADREKERLMREVISIRRLLRENGAVGLGSGNGAIPPASIRSLLPESAVVSARVHCATPSKDVPIIVRIVAPYDQDIEIGRIDEKSGAFKSGCCALTAGRHKVTVWAYDYFHNDIYDSKTIEVTIKPSSTCLVIHYGVSSELFTGRKRLKDVSITVE